MAFGDHLRQRINELKAIGENVPEIIRKNQTIATARAVDVATNMTPPNENTPDRGTGTITGQTKAHWSTDSQIYPSQSGDTFTTILGNNMEWISYLNDGHRVDQHYVPGLMVNPHSGLLERVPPEMGGIVVGTKTAYVPGIYMREGAIEAYEKALVTLFDNEIARLFDAN